MKMFLVAAIVVAAIIFVAKWIFESRKYVRYIKLHPDTAYDYFKAHPNEWLVFDVASVELIRNQLPRKKMIGPLQFRVPKKNRVVTVYGMSRDCFRGLEHLVSGKGNP